MLRDDFNGECITRYREQHNMTQQKFAKKYNEKLKEAGLKSNYRDTSISMWENGNRSPQGISEMKVLANMLGMSLDELCRNVSSVKNDESLAQGKSQEKLPEKEREFSFEIEMFIAGDLKLERVYDDAQNVNEKTQITVLSEFWMFQPIEIDLKNELDYVSSLYLYERGQYATKNALEGAKLIDEDDFLWSMCQYITNHANLFDGNSERLYDYLHWRFAEGSLSYFECFLPEDLCDIYGDLGEIKVDGKSIAKYYTTKGVLFRYRCAVDMNLKAYAQILIDYGDEIDNDVRKFNKTKVEELF